MLNVPPREWPVADAGRVLGKVVAVIPAYNEALTAASVVRGALPFVSEVIVVDDGSVDGTVRSLDGLPATVIRHGTNRGKGASLQTGIDAALASGAATVITMDADLQHQPTDIPRFLACAAAHPDHIVIGSRLADRAAFPAARYYANLTANFWISWASGLPLEDSQCGFRLYPRAVLEALKVRSDANRSFVYESELLIEAARAGFRFSAVRIPAIYAGEAARASHFRPILDVARITRMVAWKLLSRGMYLRGLVRASRRPGRSRSLKGLGGLRDQRQKTEA